MSKEFEEAKLVITADIVYDPDSKQIHDLHGCLLLEIRAILNEYQLLYKNEQITLESFICESK